MAAMKILNFAVRIHLQKSCYKSLLYNYFITLETWSCENNAYTCNVGQPKCISKELLCNKFKDCSDGSDEMKDICGWFL